jgi:hypothetical protein
MKILRKQFTPLFPLSPKYLSQYPSTKFLSSLYRTHVLNTKGTFYFHVHIYACSSMYGALHFIALTALSILGSTVYCHNRLFQATQHTRTFSPKLHLSSFMVLSLEYSFKAHAWKDETISRNKILKNMRQVAV